MTPKVSIVIANRNDVAMLAVTVRSCIEEIYSVNKTFGEIIVCDNSDEPVYENLKSALPSGYCKDGTLQIIRQPFPCLFSAREMAIERASAPYVLCLDSHMIMGRDTIERLVNFMDDHLDDETLGFAHAPISWAHQHESIAKHDRDVTTHELGDWGLAYRRARTITWKGIPWICRRSWFLDRDKGLNGYGALAEHRISWGGGDMHIGVKPWLLGFKNWAVPARPCIHIGPFPKIDVGKDPNVTTTSSQLPYRYRLYNTSGNYPHTFGFLVSCYILGGEPMMERNREILTKKFGKFLNVNKWWDKAIELGSGEKKWLDDRKVMSFEEFLAKKPWEPSLFASQVA